MASQARLAFVSGWNACRVAVDEPNVIAADDLGGFLRRGITVSAFNLLETFISQRLEELATYINGGHTQFLDLPDRLQQRAIVNTIAVANAELRWERPALADLRAYSRALGSGLQAVGTSLNLSALTWRWIGSNMTNGDYASVLSFMHVDKPWDDVRRLAGRMGFPITLAGQSLDYAADLDALAKERHRCAHVAGHGVTTVWLRSVPDRIMRYAVTFDALASLAAGRFRAGDPQILSNDSFMTDSRVALRFVRQRANDFAELRENGPRAVRVSHDFGSLWTAAQGRCGDMEVLIRQTHPGALVDWCIPSVD